VVHVTLEQTVTLRLDTLRDLLRAKGITIGEEATLTLRQSKDNGQSIEIRWPVAGQK
jgi:hypothetical protein